MHSPWVSVDLAADHVRWARLLRCAHEVMLSGRGKPAVLREMIVQSWARCIESGVDPDRPAPRLLDRDETEQRLDDHPLAAIVPLVRELLAEVAQDARHLAARLKPGTAPQRASPPLRSQLDRCRATGR